MLKFNIFIHTPVIANSTLQSTFLSMYSEIVQEYGRYVNKSKRQHFIKPNSLLSHLRLSLVIKWEVFHKLIQYFRFVATRHFKFLHLNCP